MVFFLSGRVRQVLLQFCQIIYWTSLGWGRERLVCILGFGTYQVKAKINLHSHQSLHCSLTQIMEEDEDSCQNLDLGQIGCLVYRAVEIPCPIWPTWSHFIHDKFHSGLFTCPWFHSGQVWKFLFTCPLDMYWCIKSIQFCFFIFWFMSSHNAFKQWILISWLLHWSNFFCLQESW